MSDKKKRPHDDNDDEQELNDDIDQLINRITFNRQLANSYKTRDQQYKQRIDALNSQLKQLNSGNNFEFLVSGVRRSDGDVGSEQGSNHVY
jgi:hypothetical protein